MKFEGCQAAAIWLCVCAVIYTYGEAIHELGSHLCAAPDWQD